MKWQGRRKSSNVTDARGKRVAASSAGLATLLNFVGRRFGFRGILILVALGFVAWQTGLLDPAAILGGGQVQDVSYQATPRGASLPVRDGSSGRH
jgi:predicted metalloprotease